MTIEMVYILLVCVVLTLLSLVIVAVFMLSRNRRELTQLRYEQREDQQQLAYELCETMWKSNEGILNTVSNATKVQEERLDRLYRNTEDSLQRYDIRIANINRTLDEKLDKISKTVDENLHETLDKRLNDSFSQVSERLEQVYRGLGEMQSLASGVGDLKKVLTNVKTRGIWGEMQLSALLAQMLSPSQYEENVQIDRMKQERVEFAVKLPGHDDGTLYLPIDSKFPQESYLRLVEASENADKDALATAHKELITRLNEEGKRISEKYIKPPITTDFAIMFLPIEGLYAELVKDIGAVEGLQKRHRVVVAGPSTLAALLNSLQMGFRTLAIEKRSGEVWQLLGAVKTDFARFSDVLEKTQNRLRLASEGIDSAFAQTRKIERHLRKVEALEENKAEALLDNMED